MTPQSPEEPLTMRNMNEKNHVASFGQLEGLPTEPQSLWTVEDARYLQ